MQEGGLEAEGGNIERLEVAEKHVDNKQIKIRGSWFPPSLLYSFQSEFQFRCSLFLVSYHRLSPSLRSAPPPTLWWLDLKVQIRFWKSNFSCKRNFKSSYLWFKISRGFVLDCAVGPIRILVFLVNFRQRKYYHNLCQRNLEWHRRDFQTVLVFEK